MLKDFPEFKLKAKDKYIQELIKERDKLNRSLMFTTIVAGIFFWLSIYLIIHFIL
jgi:hypothetical protein